MKSVLSISSLMVLCASATFAGNLVEPVIERTPVVTQAAVAPNWTGAYAGGNLAWAQSDVIAPDGALPGSSGDTTLIDFDGMTGALRAGYDWQFSKVIVGVGLEYGVGSLDGVGGASVGLDIFEYEIDKMASVFARVGYDAGNWLPYVLAGYTQAEFSETVISSGVLLGTRDLDGITMGLGVERRITDRWTAYAEWSYTDFDEVFEASFENEMDMSQVKLGVNYSF
ncbi:outer membrane protein [Celeribacter sp.]|uniref:outer membrane protein n=1 Tax=Celeribacter sp. TaxID=1890673 RepID=UPI003A8F20ED